jgi:signal transduction histidine kinase
VAIRLNRTGDDLEVQLADDGRGFGDRPADDGDWPRYGVAAMRERAAAIGASLALSDGPTGGGLVTLVVPIRRTAMAS